MIELRHGDLLKAPVDALVNTVNTEGVMGKGIALQFKQAYPSMYANYLAACRAGEVQMGRMHVVDLGAIFGGPRWIINFPTKRTWKSKSKVSDIASGLADLIDTIRRLQIASIAVPPLGCGSGGLKWDTVLPLIRSALDQVPNVRALVFAPQGAPEAKEMSTRTEAPEMTIGRASLLGLANRYRKAMLDPIVSLLELHKLMYFMQEAGQPLRLNYTAGKFGPYASNLRQVMIRLEGHWLLGYGDGEDDPTKAIELIGDAAAESDRFLASHHDVLARMDRVSKLIEGFEDPYGLELLSSTHWVMCSDVVARDSSEGAADLVLAWNARKRKIFKRQHLHLAWMRLRELSWHTESRSALH